MWEWIAVGIVVSLWAFRIYCKFDKQTRQILKLQDFIKEHFYDKTKIDADVKATQQNFKALEKKFSGVNHKISTMKSNTNLKLRNIQNTRESNGNVKFRSMLDIDYQERLRKKQKSAPVKKNKPIKKNVPKEST